MEDKALILRDLFRISDRQHNIPWQPFREGVDIQVLYGNIENGPATALLRYQPGASVPEHIHTGFEHVLVLSGSQTDRQGEYEIGTLAINAPGTSHNVKSENGCIVLIIWEKPVYICP